MTPRWWRRWPGWIGYLAAAWALTYGLFGLYWALGGAGFPFGENDPGAALSVLGGAQAETGGPVIAALGLAGAVAAAAIARTGRRGILRVMLLGFAWGAAATLALVIPDYRVLVAVALVTTGAKDRAGNRLDQNRTQPNNQQKVWTFTTGSIQMRVDT